MNCSKGMKDRISRIHPEVFLSDGSSACFAMKSKFGESVPLGCYTRRLDNIYRRFGRSAGVKHSEKLTPTHSLTS